MHVNVVRIEKSTLTLDKSITFRTPPLWMNPIYKPLDMRKQGSKGYSQYWICTNSGNSYDFHFIHPNPLLQEVCDRWSQRQVWNFLHWQLAGPRWQLKGRIEMLWIWNRLLLTHIIRKCLPWILLCMQHCHEQSLSKLCHLQRREYRQG